MNRLTVSKGAAMLPPVALIGGTGLASRYEAAQPQTCGFFVQKILAHHIMTGLSGALARVAGSFSGTPILLSPVTNDWRYWRQVYNLIREAVMKHHSKTHLTSYFNVYHFRQLIAENVPGSRAINFKLFNPALSVKFTRMGALS